MVNTRISLNCARAQSPFSPKASLIWPSAAFLQVMQQANGFTLCIPSLSHEPLWAWGIAMPDRSEVLNNAGKGTVV
jgi:hypothetical protein